MKTSYNIARRNSVVSKYIHVILYMVSVKTEETFCRYYDNFPVVTKFPGILEKIIAIVLRAFWSI